MNPPATKSSSITDSLTFNFQRTVQSEIITNNLYIYSCFLTQYMYEVNDNEIYFSFKVSSLLNPNCKIDQINELKNIIEKMFLFKISNDQLKLSDPSGIYNINLIRAKINYTSIIPGIWQFSNPRYPSSTFATINGTNAYLCSNLLSFDYSIGPTISKYPFFNVNQINKMNCTANPLSNLFSQVLIFKIAANRTQLILYDNKGAYLMTADKKSSISPNKQIEMTNN
jgi:hypothetical protein